MAFLDHINIKGFRRLLNIDLELRPLMVVIGANGVGKTSLLDIFDLLASSAEGKLNASINGLGGITSLITYDRTEQLSITIYMIDPKFGRIVSKYPKPFVYELIIIPKSISYTIEKESFSRQKVSTEPKPFYYIESNFESINYFDFKQNQMVQPYWEYSYLETSLSQAPKISKELEFFRRRLALSSYYHFLNVEPRSPIRLPQPMQPAELPGKNGEDLVSCLYSMRETDRDRFEIVQDTLRSVFPGFERLDFPPVAAGVLAMTWKDANFKKPLYMHQLSEGTLRFLWLTTLLQSPGLPDIMLIDEPEVSLHPEMLSMLVELMREASQRSQIIVATHSDRLVRFLKPEELVVMDLQEDGTAGARWADSLDIEKWLQDYSLDEVWRMGRIGGRA